jgi:hypothetical protein
VAVGGGELCGLHRTSFRGGIGTTGFPASRRNKGYDNSVTVM